MKKRKFNILLNIAVLCMCVCAIAIGVYSAKTASLNVSGTIGFTAHNCKVRVLGKITGAVDSSNNALDPATTTALNYQESAGTGKLIDGTADSWNFDKIYFDDLNAKGDAIATDIVFTFTLTNESTDYDVIATLNVNNLPSNVKPTVTFNSDSNNSGFECELKKAGTSVTLTLTLSLVTSQEISNTVKNIDFSLSFNKVNQNQTATSMGYTFNNGTIEDVPAATDSNATLTIPNYFYDTTNNNVVFVKKIQSSIPLAITNLKNYTNIVFPSSLVYLGVFSLSGGINLTKITIPYNVNQIDQLVFQNCHNATQIDILGWFESIKSAFSNCEKLTTIFIQNSVKTFNNQAFYNCSALTSINYNGTIKQWESITKDTGWNQSLNNCTVYCVDGNISI